MFFFFLYIDSKNGSGNLMCSFQSNTYLVAHGTLKVASQIHPSAISPWQLNWHRPSLTTEIYGLPKWSRNSWMGFPILKDIYISYSTFIFKVHIQSSYIHTYTSRYITAIFSSSFTKKLTWGPSTRGVPRTNY